MLRSLLGEPPRQNEGILAEAMDSMAQMSAVLRKEIKARGDSAQEFRKMEIWIEGLISSLDELEQSWHAAAHFRQSVQSEYADELSPKEQEEYARYVYFYKNGFIRVFSLLDKLGTVLNELYDLNTSKVKEHFSYFTVLRQFRAVKAHSRLADKLFAIKDSYRDAMQILRRRRNAEIHYMNSEMQDDMWQRAHDPEEKVKLEDLDRHLDELKQGLEMVCKTLAETFRYSLNEWRKTGRRR